MQFLLWHIGTGMIKELRRSKRINDYLPIAVTAQNGNTGELQSTSFSGRIIDISDHGACLLMSQIMKNNFHIFHSTREDDAFFLQLTINVPPDNINFSITARPVWMNLFRQDEIRAFKMGVDFLTHPESKQMKQLQKAIKRQQQQRGSWWASQHLTSNA